MPETYYLLAVIEKEAGNFDQAAALLKNVVKLQPSNGMALSSTSGAFRNLILSAVFPFTRSRLLAAGR